MGSGLESRDPGHEGGFMVSTSFLEVNGGDRLILQSLKGVGGAVY